MFCLQCPINSNSRFLKNSVYLYNHRSNLGYITKCSNFIENLSMIITVKSTNKWNEILALVNQ